MAKMSGQGVQTHHRMATEHGLWQAVRMMKQGLLTLSQWSRQHIRIGYDIVRVWCSQVSCASPWGSLDRGARLMSSWGIRMELIRISMRTPCHPGEGSLHLAHTDGPPCDIAQSTRGRIQSDRHFTSGHLTAGWERKTFQLLQSDISRSSDSTYPESIRDRHFSLPEAILHSVAVFSWNFLIFPTYFLRYFALDIWCLNPQTLLVIHLS